MELFDIKEEVKRKRNHNELNDKRYEIEVLKSNNWFREGEVSVVYEHTDRENFVFEKDPHILISKDKVRIVRQLSDAK